MTTITASLVKELRERTGSGMMECKKALEAASGDIEVAIEKMRKAGKATAAKKAGRIAAEGSIVIQKTADAQAACMLEINCETDFVARDQSFMAFAEAVAKRALSAKVSDVASLLPLDLDGKTIEQTREAYVSQLGENITIRRVVTMTASGVVGHYLHGNRIGVLVWLSVPQQELARDLAMHIAACKPLALEVADLAPELLAQEEAVYLAQVQASGKPPVIIEKMLAGKMQKFINEVVLVNQAFIKDPEITIAELLQKSGAKIISFVRYEVGEGIDKKTTDFASEVMSQVNERERI